MELNEKQLAFAEGILNGKSQKDAYHDAGFKATTDQALRSAASRLASDPAIRAYLAERRREIQHDTNVTQARVIQEIARVGFSDIRDFIRWDEDGAFFVPSEHLTETQAAAIQSVKIKKRTTTREDGDITETVETEIKLHPKMDALEKLAKHLNLYQGDGINDALRETHLLATVLWRFVMALHVSKQMPVPTALKYAEQNPEEVEQWGREQKLLAPGSVSTN